MEVDVWLKNSREHVFLGTFYTDNNEMRWYPESDVYNQQVKAAIVQMLRRMAQQGELQDGQDIFLQNAGMVIG